MAAVLGTRPGDVVFTGSGSEAANLAVLGRVRALPGAMVTSAVEHHAVLRAVEAGERAGYGEARVVGVDSDGAIDLDELSRALDDSVSIVSVQLANNEVGTLQPIADVARWCGGAPPTPCCTPTPCRRHPGTTWPHWRRAPTW